jgi:hypothetical protein
VEVVKDTKWPAYTPPAVFNSNQWSAGRCELASDALGGWKFHRVREDKSTANDIRTVRNVEKSMNAGITQQSLCDMLVEVKRRVHPVSPPKVVPASSMPAAPAGASSSTIALATSTPAAQPSDSKLEALVSTLPTTNASNESISADEVVDGVEPDAKRAKLVSAAETESPPLPDAPAAE